jgi:hypothetical protein
MSLKNVRQSAAIIAISAIVGASCLLAGAASATTTEINYWSFDETQVGAAAVDSIGGNSGVASGNPAPAPSVDVPYASLNTGSMQFDGQNYFQVNNTLGADFSICAWVKTSLTSGTNHWENSPIVDSEMGGPAYDFGFGINSAGNLSFGNGGDIAGSGPADATIAGTKIVNDNVWHNLCVTRNNTTGEDILYVDGAADGSGTTGTGLDVVNSQIWIGAGQDGNAPFVGLIDDVRFFTTVVTPTAVHEIFSPTPPPVDQPETPIVVDNQGDVLAHTGGKSTPLLPLGASLILAGAGVAVVARARSKR